MDLFVILAVIFASGIMTVIAAKIYTTFRTTWEPTDSTAISILSSGDTMLTVFDTAFVIFFVGVSIAAIIGAFMIQTHPAFFFVSVILLGVLLVIAPRFTNAWSLFINADEMSSVANTYTKTNYIMTKLPTLLLGVGILVLIALYSKMQGGGGAY